MGRIRIRQLKPCISCGRIVNRSIVKTCSKQCYSIARKNGMIVSKGQFEKGHQPNKITLLRGHAKISEMRKGKTLEQIYGIEKARELKEKLKISSRKTIETQYRELLRIKSEFESQGYKFIPFVKVIPDAIAIKDGKIFAVEVEHNVPNYDKYIGDIKTFYDDIIWIIHRKSDIKCKELRSI